MSTQFVLIYHPLIPSTADEPALVAVQSLDEWYAKGWLLVDPDAEPPVVDTPYYSTAAADSRFAKVDDIDDPGTLAGDAVAAASVAAIEVAGSVAPAGAWDFTTAPTVGGAPLGATPADASTAARGIVELATTAETTTGTDTVRAVTPAGVKVVADTKVAVSGGTLTGGVKVPTIAVGNGVANQKRLPVNVNVVIDGSTLGSAAADGTDKVASLLAVTVRGGFSGEAGFGVSNPGFVWAANDFMVSGPSSGDLAGITQFWGRLSEAHLYTPGAALSEMYGLIGQVAVEASATGASISGFLASVRADGPRNSAGITIGNAASLYVTSPAAGTATNQYAIYVAGTERSFIGGKIIANDGIQVNGPTGAFKVNATTPNVQGAAAGVYAGVNGGSPAVELADGTTNWRMDNSSGVLRFLRAGVASRMELDGTGNLKVGGGVGFFNTTPITAKRTTTADATDLATAITLVNALKADLQAIGLKA